MSGPATVIWDASFTDYDFGPSHPMNPLRADLTVRLARELGVLDRPGVRVVNPAVASDADLRRVHEQHYIDGVREAGATLLPDERHGLGSDDNPVFPDMHEASAHVVGGTLRLAEEVWSGRALHGANIAGGLHHAMAGYASGFCVYNDVAVGISRLLELGAQRVAYVDIDVHHGDGVERAFWDDPRVLTISVHESGRTLWPGTGWADDSGGTGAEGSAVNLALPAGTGDERWLRAFHSVVPPLVRSFQPEVLVTQHGCDSHVLDPLANLALTVDAQRAAALALHDLAHEVAAGRWIATGGGGYEIVDVVPRAWAHLLAIATGEPVEPTTPTPAGWREYVTELLGRPAPARMTDGRTPHWRPWEEGYDPSDAVDRAIMATRVAAFPAHGLDPQP
ncbi:MAG: acetoin utilization protein AcuC [Actinomycetales bacterium]